MKAVSYIQPTTNTMEKPDSPEKVPVAFFKKRSAKSKANLRKRPATPPPADSDSDFSSSENEVGQRVKRRKRTALITAASSNPASGKGDFAATVFTADRSAPITSTNDATKQSNWFDEVDTLSAKKLLGSTRQLPSMKDGAQPDGTYKGLANQTSFIQKNPDAPTRTVGPIKAPTNIRTITVTDFAPDVCKDYKLTGFCGFGDNCKFLHSREDYKQGWQLDKEWETVTKGKKNLGGTVVASTRRDKLAPDDDDDEDEEALLNGIPFKCHICKGPYRDPIMTRCGHYFCESCALKRSSTTCAACGVGTSGLFKTATGLQKLLARKRERAARRRQEALEAGEEVSEEEEEDE
ncbi:hypothetical protein CDD80_6727 [Ophiocordyceps camponoti-rufipedis]|uniref:Pre-mRNA-splicing factor CWC24 n=1 Tax=Ophiocordyceps camponoti-rufipedis TaxID=2004952 RepID=A0A2C5XEF8_9HYPO|nr:hypothetical protein CDD80_6727 [Ophiocordyceps camponoti-rufipedis]